jgi:hypothetical protein
MTPYDQEKDHSGRFRFDDTIRKWIVRILATIGFFTVAALVLLAVGLYHLAT